MKKLLASSSSVEGIRRLIAKFYYTEPDKIKLSPVGDDTLLVSNMIKLLDGVIVRVKKNRYRFELNQGANHEKR